MTRNRFRPHQGPRRSPVRPDSADGIEDGSGDSAGRELFGLSAYQRLVLSCLATRGGDARTLALARDIASWQDRPNPSSTAMREIYLAVHGTVEDLAAMGLVRYSEDDGTVELT